MYACDSTVPNHIIKSQHVICHVRPFCVLRVLPHVWVDDRPPHATLLPHTRTHIRTCDVYISHKIPKHQQHTHVCCTKGLRPSVCECVRLCVAEVARNTKRHAASGAACTESSWPIVGIVFRAPAFAFLHSAVQVPEVVRTSGGDDDADDHDDDDGGCGWRG